MKPILKRLEPRVTTRRDAEGHGGTNHWRSWYSLARWRELRERVFERDNYTCQCGCKTLILRPHERIADHKIEHQGDQHLFWSENNVQTLWKPHHDGWKQRLERARRAGGGSKL